jgi:hypothetical protein
MGASSRRKADAVPWSTTLGRSAGLASWMRAREMAGATGRTALFERVELLRQDALL